MHKRYYAQRQQLVASLNTLLYQLHTLSFFMSPSLWTYGCRIISQFQCSKPSDIDLAPSLRFFFALIFFLNFPSISTHVIYGAAEGRAVILDFVGMSYVPSKLQLFALDTVILSLQFILITIAYETAWYEKSTDVEDALLPNMPSTPFSSSLPTPITSRPSSPTSSRTAFTDNTHTKSTEPTNTCPYIVDLRLQLIVDRLKRPLPSPPNSTSGTSLPFPNTTRWPLAAGVRMFMGSQRMVRRNTGQLEGVVPAAGGGVVPVAQVGSDGERRIPGAMDVDT